MTLKTHKNSQSEIPFLFLTKTPKCLCEPQTVLYKTHRKTDSYANVAQIVLPFCYCYGCPFFPSSLTPISIATILLLLLLLKRCLFCRLFHSTDFRLFLVLQRIWKWKSSWRFEKFQNVCASARQLIRTEKCEQLFRSNEFKSMD